jgi:hypothetical protein
LSQAKSDLRLLVRKWPGAVAEHRFHGTRRWRFDYAWPERRIAVEYEGIFASKSRHTTATGYSNDAEKYSTAAVLGWCVIRVTAPMIRDGRAADLIELAHEARK